MKRDYFDFAVPQRPGGAHKKPAFRDPVVLTIPRLPDGGELPPSVRFLLAMEQKALAEAQDACPPDTLREAHARGLEPYALWP
ncbi:MAG: hypothetical protein AAF845_05615 [Bacteroidota bacterium]